MSRELTLRSQSCRVRLTRAVYSSVGRTCLCNVAAPSVRCYDVAPMAQTPLPKALLQQLTPRLPEMLSLLRAYVVTESPSLEKTAVDRCCAVVAKAWRSLSGARIDRIVQKHRG